MFGFAKKRIRRRRLFWRADFLLLALAMALVLILYERFCPPTGEAVFHQPNAGNVVDDSDGGETPPTGPEVKAGQSVRFLMYNVQNYFVQGERQRSRYTLTPKKEASRNAVADTIASVRPDIVGLVEIGGPRALDDLAARLAVRGLEYPHRRVLTREGEDRALAFLSRYPIVCDDSKAEYGLLGSQRRKMLRGILDVTVQTPDKRCFRILGVHLKSHKGESEAATQALRTKEARTLAFYVRNIAKYSPKTPLLVYGDWNDGPADSSMRVLTQGVSKEATLRRLQPTDTNGDAWTHYYRDGGEYLIYDRIYVNAVLFSRMGRKSKSGVEMSRPGSSDHRAVWCELR